MPSFDVRVTVEHDIVISADDADEARRIAENYHTHGTLVATAVTIEVDE